MERHFEQDMEALKQSLLSMASHAEAAVQESVDALLQRDDALDVVIPRGGESLIRAVVEQSRIPVIKHYKGVCFVYVDQAADLAMAESITLNAKVQRPSACNAAEQLLVHRAVAELSASRP